jgi:hypothetical protein
MSTVTLSISSAVAKFKATFAAAEQSYLDSAAITEHGDAALELLTLI